MPGDLSIRNAALEVPRRVALVAEGRDYSYEEIAGRVAIVSARLAAMGLGAGSLIALHSGNRVETVAALLACFELGVSFVPVDPRLTPGEAALLLEDAAPHAVLDETALARLSEPGPAPDGAGPRSRRVATPAAESLLALVYTSGTTGRAKGALLSRRAFLSSAQGSAVNLGWEPDDRWSLCLPLCHVGGLSILTRCLSGRAGVVLEPRFDAVAVLESMSRHGVSLLSVVPTTLRALLAEDREGRLARLRAILVGGAPAPFELMEECARRGIAALATYGLTEACSQVTVQRPERPPRARRGAGRTLPGMELEIRDEKDDVVAHGETGRIHVRGGAMMDGYRGQAPLAGRWFDTGDLGACDEDGTLHVRARRTDLIVTGGENVYPAEVEQALERCAGVGHALVFGVSDERFGQVVAAAIVPSEGVPLDEGRLRREIEGRLASYKRPRRWCVVGELPQSRGGKVDRAAARAAFSSRLRPFGG